MSPAIIQRLVAVAAAASTAAHGQKEPIYQAAMLELGINRATFFRKLKAVAPRAPRKRRTDAGNVVLPMDEALILSAYLMEGYRKNNRKITSLKEAVTVLRANGKIIAGSIDTGTGEITELSLSAIGNALRCYTLHPDQLRQATPHVNLQSLYPNHVWQVDGSVCVIYYLPGGGAELVELDQAVHYKNKPQNLKAIEQFRVIRYVVTDHASGTVRYRYYPHSESGEHTVMFIAWAMAPKASNDPFQGAPKIIMVDPGATSGGLVRRFCARMGIELIVNQQGNPRGKGSVEKGNHIVETTFEQALRYTKERPKDFNDINQMAERFQLWWNSTEIHSRTKKTRFAVWLTITAEQLRTTPAADVLLSLATNEPVNRKVNGDLTIGFKSRVWNVSEVPGIFIGDTVAVHWHPFMDDTAMAVLFGEDGHEQHIALPEIKRNELGFLESAAVIGEQFKAAGDTVADTNRKKIQRISTGATTQDEAEKKQRNKNHIPFNGEIDPLKHTRGELPTFMQKRGTALNVQAPTVELLKMNPVQTAKWLHGRLGSDYRPELLADVQARFPGGPTEEDLETILVDLAAGRSATGKANLRAVL